MALKPGVRGVEVFRCDEGVEVDLGVDGVEVFIEGEGFEVDLDEDDDSDTFVELEPESVEVGVMGGVDVGYGVVVASLLAPPPSLDGNEMTNTPSFVFPFTSFPNWSAMDRMVKFKTEESPAFPTVSNVTSATLTSPIRSCPNM